MPNMGQWELQRVSSMFVQTQSVAAHIGFNLLNLVIFDLWIACLVVKRDSILAISLPFSECSLFHCSLQEDSLGGGDQISALAQVSLFRDLTSALPETGSLKVMTLSLF